MVIVPKRYETLKSDVCVVIKGAGEMATEVGCRLFNRRLKVVLTEIDKPLAGRRAAECR